MPTKQQLGLRQECTAGMLCSGSLREDWSSRNAKPAAWNQQATGRRRLQLRCRRASL